MSFAQLVKILLFGFPVPEEFIDSAYPLFLQTSGGLCLTLLVSVMSLAIGLPLGALFAAGRECSRKPGLPAWRRRVYSVIDLCVRMTVGTIQGLPIMLTVMLFFYLPYPWFGVRAPAVMLATAAFSVYAAALMTEVFRSGFKAVPAGLIDASRALGMNERDIWLRIRFPIIVRVMLPSLVGIAVTIFKDTSVLMVVGVAELTFTSRQAFVSSPAHYGTVLFMVVAAYWLISSSGSLAAEVLEKKARIRGWCRAV